MSDSLATGQHYKQYLIRPEHVGQPLDPAMIVAIRGGSMPPMLFTAMKKTVECGERGVKTYKQDVEGAIGALQRELELIKLKESYNSDKEQCIDKPIVDKYPYLKEDK